MSADAPEDVPLVGADGHVPHVQVLAAVTGAIIMIFAIVTFLVLRDPSASAETKGGIIATWQNLAMTAGGFWLGSSLAGKMVRR